jgi:6-phosphofructokinase 1
MKKIGILTSGGDAPGMNACIRAVVRSALHNKLEVYGIYNGYEGMINGDIQAMDFKSVANIIQRGGTILKTSRSERFRTAEGRQAAFDQLRQQGIDALVAIGGNGTFTGAELFSSEFDIPVIGAPGTIDNDLYGTDYTIGFDTAVNTALDAIDKIRDTAESHGRTFFIEVMGRDTGFIAIHAGIAGGAEVVVIPETDTSMQEMDKLIANSKRSFSIIVVAEGDEAGGAFALDKKIKERHPGFQSRVTILGHIQRGGRPTAFDRLNASMMGAGAVDALMRGERNKMVGVVNGQVTLTPFAEAISMRKTINPYYLHLAEVLA